MYVSFVELKLAKNGFLQKSTNEGEKGGDLQHNAKKVSIFEQLGLKFGRSRQASRQEDRHIVRNARVQPTASSTAIQTQVAPSLGTSVSSRTIRRRLPEGHMESRHPLRVLPLTPIHRRLRLERCHARGN
ncbi:transposable element Tcb2 transposase [Trichonephila clavipes]|nr:transposable element Tcb2 transposase [Trichonephila clavipes]